MTEQKWQEVTAERFDEMLGAVPPFRMSGGAFALGELVDHIDGRPVADMYIEVDGRFYHKLDFLGAFDAHKYRQQVREQR